LDNDVSKLKLLKAEHQSKHYRLEDDLLTHFPEKIANIKERIAGIEANIVSYNTEVEKFEAFKIGDTTPFPTMTIGGTVYAEKEAASKEKLQMPFSGEAELAAKETPLAALNAELNIDDRGSEGITMTVTNDEENEEFGEGEPQYAYGKRKPSILDNLKNYSSKNADLRGFGKGEQEQ
jgi:hypothetical protein